MGKSSVVIDINLIKLRRFLRDLEYRQKEIMMRKQWLYDYDYKKFLERSGLKSKENTMQ